MNSGLALDNGLVFLSQTCLHVYICFILYTLYEEMWDMQGKRTC